MVLGSTRMVTCRAISASGRSTSMTASAIASPLSGVADCCPAAGCNVRHHPVGMQLVGVPGIGGDGRALRSRCRGSVITSPANAVGKQGRRRSVAPGQQIILRAKRAVVGACRRQQSRKTITTVIQRQQGHGRAVQGYRAWRRRPIPASRRPRRVRDFGGAGRPAFSWSGAKRSWARSPGRRRQTRAAGWRGAPVFQMLRCGCRRRRPATPRPSGRRVFAAPQGCSGVHAMLTGIELRR